MQLRFHTQTAGSTLTAQQPDNNIVRVAMQALAAVLGGTQSLHCNGRDEALALPTEEAARIALRTQQIIASESGVANTVDPFGGAWAIEQRTDEIEREARALIDAIDAAGGTLAAIESGRIQRQIQDAAYAAQQAIDRGEQVIVGVNRYHDRRAGDDRAAAHRSGERAAAGRGGAGGAAEPRRRARGRPRSTALERAARDGAQPRAARASPRSKRARRSARSPTRCGASSASTVTIFT